MLDIEPIKRRLKAITPGRREVERDTGTGGFFVSALVGPGWETVARFAVDCGGDAVFDAKAPDDIAALIEEVERLRHWLIAMQDGGEGLPASIAREVETWPRR